MLVEIPRNAKFLFVSLIDPYYRDNFEGPDSLFLTIEKDSDKDGLPDNWTDIYAAAKKAREWAKKNKGPDYYGFTFAASKAGHIHLAFLSALTYS